MRTAPALRMALRVLSTSLPSLRIGVLGDVLAQRRLKRRLGGAQVDGSLGEIFAVEIGEDLVDAEPVQRLGVARLHPEDLPIGEGDRLSGREGAELALHGVEDRADLRDAIPGGSGGLDGERGEIDLDCGLGVEGDLARELGLRRAARERAAIVAVRAGHQLDGLALDVEPLALPDEAGALVELGGALVEGEAVQVRPAGPRSSESREPDQPDVGAVLLVDGAGREGADGELPVDIRRRRICPAGLVVPDDHVLFSEAERVDGDANLPGPELSVLAADVEADDPALAS